MNTTAGRSVKDGAADNAPKRDATHPGLKPVIERLGSLFQRGRDYESASVGTDHEASELALLREENAYLRMKLAAKPNVSRAVEAINGLNAHAPEGTTDDGWNVLVESLVIRDTLIDACRELVSATNQLEGRLLALDPQDISSNGAQTMFGELNEHATSRARAPQTESAGVDAISRIAARATTDSLAVASC